MLTKKELKSQLYRPYDEEYSFEKINKNCIKLTASVRNHIVMGTSQLYTNLEYRIKEEGNSMIIVKF